MSLEDCLNAARKGKEVSGRQARDATLAWRRAREQYRAQGMSDVDADQAAGAELAKVFRYHTERNKRLTLMRAQYSRRNRLAVSAAAREDIPLLPLRRVVGDFSSNVQFENAASTRDALLAQIHGRISSLLTRHKEKLLGGRKAKAKEKDLLAAAFNEAGASAESKAIAKAIDDTNKWLVKLYNNAGGAIRELEVYGWPTKHNRTAILRGANTDAELDAAFKEWSDFIIENNMMDWSRIEDRATGLPFASPGSTPSLDVQRDFLRKAIFDSIREDGWRGRDVSWGMSVGDAVKDRYGRHRVLHFANSKAWMDYQAKYGSERSPVDALLTHYSTMARDIALMRTLGPEPSVGLEDAINHAQKAVAGYEKLETKTRKRADLARAALAHVSAETSVPGSEFWANFFASSRNIMASARLGRAVLVAPGDTVLSINAAKSIGMNPSNIMSQFVRNLAGVGREDLLRMGYIADTIASASSAAQRVMGEIDGHEVTRIAANATFRSTGLSYWTDNLRLAWQSGMSGHLLTLGNDLSKIEGPLGKMLRGRGVTQRDWEAIIDPKYQFTASNGAKFTPPSYWMQAAISDGMDPARASRIALRVDGIIQEITEAAVPVRSDEVRAAVLGRTRPGTLAGEVMRSLANLKTFSFNMMLATYRNIATRQTIPGKIGAFATAAGGLTALGGIGLQLKEMSKGREPRAMDTPEFWIAAGLQGGAMGPLGDIAATGTTPHFGGFMGYVAGPSAQLIGDVLNLTLGNAAKAARGENTRFAREGVKLVRGMTPTASHWYLAAAEDRLVWDRLQMFLDPRAEKALLKAAKKRSKEHGNEEWWNTGDLSPFQ